MKQIVILILAVLFLGGISMAVFHYPADHIESVTLVDGKIEIVKSHDYGVSVQSMQCQNNGGMDLVYKPLELGRLEGNILLLPSNNMLFTKRIWKEIYIAKDGKIVLEKTIEGKIIPAQNERWEFPE